MNCASYSPAVVSGSAEYMYHTGSGAPPSVPDAPAKKAENKKAEKKAAKKAEKDE